LEGEAMGKDGAKAKGKEASGKGKQAGGGGGADKGGAADKGKGKKESKSDGLGTCTYVKGMKLLCFLKCFSLSLSLSRAEKTRVHKRDSVQQDSLKTQKSVLRV